MLINQTNDAWFDGSCGALQHLSQCVFRCVENRVPCVRVANTGISCFLDATGQMDMLAGGDGSTCLAGFKPGLVRYPEANRGGTFYTQWGDWPFALPCGLATLAAFVLVLVAERRRMKSHTQGVQP